MLPEPFPSLTTAIRPRLKSTSKQSQRDQQTAIFIRTLIFIAIAIILFFILIILIITMLVKSYRFRASSTSSEDKVSSSSFAQSTSTALSMDLSTNPTSHYHQQLEPTRASISPITSADSFQHYDNYLSKTGIVHGLVPQAILSPRFHRQQQVLDERRRTPLQIRSPSLSRINPFIDHASLATTKERQGSKRVSSPQVTRLENGDVIISA